MFKASQPDCSFLGPSSTPPPMVSLAICHLPFVTILLFFITLLNQSRHQCFLCVFLSQRLKLVRASPFEPRIPEINPTTSMRVLLRLPSHLQPSASPPPSKTPLYTRPPFFVQLASEKNLTLFLPHRPRFEQLTVLHPQRAGMPKGASRVVEQHKSATVCRRANQKLLLFSFSSTCALRHSSFMIHRVNQ